MRFLLLLTLAFFASEAISQIPSTALPGPHQVGTNDFTFTDNSLASPDVDVRIYYPATSSGTNSPWAAGQYHVLAFGHGFNLNYLDYEETCEHLASWGYIVVTPDVQNGFGVDHEEFARELAACIQHIQAENANSGSQFYQRVGTKSGVLGHSMGGGASALVPSVFAQVDAVSGLASAETNPSAIAALGNYSGPYQVISGSSDNTADETGNQIPMYNAATGEKQWLSITGGAHCKFTDGTTICDLVSSPGSVTRDEQKRLAQKYLTAFFNYHLQGDLDALPFICGDSVAADVAANRVANSTNISCNVMGLNDVPAPAWEAWPNPARDALHLKGLSEVTVFGMDGKMVERIAWEGEERVVSTVKWKSGLYWLRDASGAARLLSVVH